MPTMLIGLSTFLTQLGAPTSQDMQGIPAQQGGLPSPDPPFVPSVALATTSEAMEAEMNLIGGVSGGVSEKDAAIEMMGSSAKWARDQGRINDKVYGERLASQLADFRWRFRIQEHFLFAFQNLEAKDLVSIDDSFKYPIAWKEISATVNTLFHALECFEIANDSTSIVSDFGLFDAPVEWLAIAIGRTCTDVPKAFLALRASGTLGVFDGERFKKMGGLEMKVNPLEMACDEQKKVPQIGFWLPQNLRGRSDMRLWACGAWERYRLMRLGYEQSHGEGSWGDDELVQVGLKEWINGQESA